MTEEENALSSHVFLCRCRASSQAHLSSGGARGSQNCSGSPLMMEMSNSNENSSSLVFFWFLIPLELF